MPRQKSTHVDSPKAVGERLRAAREAAGLSQRQLAFPGCSPAYISRIEAGDRIPSLQLLRELGRRLGVTEDYLATGELQGSREFSLLEAELALRLDDLGRASVLYTEALAEARTPRERSTAEEGLGHLAYRTGDLGEAVKFFEQALVTSGDEEWERPALAESLGRAYASLGELEPCIAIFERCLEAFERMDDHVEATRFACLLGYALSDSGEFARAEAVVSKALAAGSESFDPYMRARVYWSKAKLRVDQGDADGASRYAYQALAALQLTEDLHYTGLAHALIAHIELERDRPDEALAHLEQGWPLVERSGSPLDRAHFLVEQARALARLGRSEQAEELATEIRQLLADAEPIEAGRIHAVLAEVAVDSGEVERAIDLYETAASYLERNIPNRYLVDVYAKLADLLEAEGRADAAYRYMKKAVGMQQAVLPRRPV
ncbi:MAG TPA: helix-turn-helix domain-containing protein [Gaiellaceae bacterium]|nr:helix-turn-helix domain-containing protein [Gaiellaceae bacterium]